MKLLLAGHLALAATAFTGGQRPNILFAFADDWGRHASAYAQLDAGGMIDVVQTPHFDAIGAG
jgi:N-sulfoglucosamine sulfohydrolase